MARILIVVANMLTRLEIRRVADWCENRSQSLRCQKLALIVLGGNTRGKNIAPNLNTHKNKTIATLKGLHRVAMGKFILFLHFIKVSFSSELSQSSD